jgi:hypothetical protein
MRWSGSLDEKAEPLAGWIVGPDGEVLGLASRERPFITATINLREAECAKQTYPRYVLE